MSGWIVLAIIVLFVFLCFHVALREVLLKGSDGELERELAQCGRLERTRWMIGRQLDLANVVQWKSTAIQCAIVLLVLLDFCGFGAVDVTSVLLAFVVVSSRDHQGRQTVVVHRLHVGLKGWLLSRLQ